jgi:cation diffusion facilitator CzcD-associated flavoprotein CzcO
MSNRYLVIGAGPVGLAMAKSLKQAKIPYDQIEAHDDVGGNWHHGVYETAHILSSRVATEYPDFPMPKHYPDFPSATQMYEYYKLYTEHYELREGIRFNTKLMMLNP